MTTRRFAFLRKRHLRIAMMMCLPLLFSIVARVPAVHAYSTLTCQSTQVPVALAPNGPKQYQLFGELCTKNNQTSGVVQVLLPGASYTHLYWRFPYQPQMYSYVDALTTPNYSTFNIDRLSSGQSSQPSSNLVTLDADAYTVHQVIQGLRDGTATGVRFTKVVLVGHSLGSYLLWDEVATYHDVDGVIVTGALHKSSPSNSQEGFSFAYPATEDPKFQDSGLDSGYYTTTAATPTSPSGRQVLFYNLPDADPNVLSIDESTKDVFALSELIQGLDASNLAKSSQITVPVLDVVGQFDFFVCGPGGTDCSTDQAVQQAEAPYFPPQACLEAHILPNAGHDINLHLNAPTWFQMAKAWLDKFYGDDAVAPGHCN